MKRDKIVTFGGFDAFVFLEGKDPKKIQICKKNSEDVIIEFNTDAVDCMGFSDISKQLEDLTLEAQQAAVHCLAEALKKYYGGKNFLAVPKKLEKIFYAEGFRILPEIPNGNPYKRLMVVSKNDLDNNLAKVAFAQNDKLAILFKRYALISDKVILKAKAEEISRLFIDNASYASNEDKRKGYSAQAIEHRINNENVYSFALHDTQENKILACMRVYIKSGIGAYASDLVTMTEKRHQGLAILLMKEVFSSLKEETNTIFLIAGDDKEMEYYEKQLGFKSICSLNDSFDLGNDKIFMFGLFPQQKLLKEFLDDFPMPLPPQEAAKSQYPAFNAIIKKADSRLEKNDNENMGNQTQQMS